MGKIFRRILIWVAPLALGYIMKRITGKSAKTNTRR